MNSNNHLTASAEQAATPTTRLAIALLVSCALDWAVLSYPRLHSILISAELLPSLVTNIAFLILSVGISILNVRITLPHLNASPVYYKIVIWIKIAFTLMICYHVNYPAITLLM